MDVATDFGGSTKQGSGHSTQVHFSTLKLHAVVAHRTGLLRVPFEVTVNGQLLSLSSFCNGEEANWLYTVCCFMVSLCVCVMCDAQISALCVLRVPMERGKHHAHGVRNSTPPAMRTVRRDHKIDALARAQCQMEQQTLYRHCDTHRTTARGVRADLEHRHTLAACSWDRPVSILLATHLLCVCS